MYRRWNIERPQMSFCVLGIEYFRSLRVQKLFPALCKVQHYFLWNKESLKHFIISNSEFNERKYSDIFFHEDNINSLDFADMYICICSATNYSGNCLCQLVRDYLTSMAFIPECNNFEFDVSLRRSERVVWSREGCVLNK